MRYILTKIMALALIVVSLSSHTLASEPVREVQAITAKALRNLSLAQQYIDNKQFDAAKKELNTLVQGQARLNAHEVAMTYSLLGFIAYTQEDLKLATTYYEKVLVKSKSIPKSLEFTTVYGLAQLYFSDQRYQNAIRLMMHWLRITEEQSVQANLMIAQSFYQLKQYKRGIKPILSAIEINKEKGKPAEENWLLLLRVLYYENKQPDKAIEVMQQLIALNPKKQYWQQLAGLYGQMQQVEKQTQVYESLYVDNLLDDEQDWLIYAQLLASIDLPFYAAEIINEGIEKGFVEKNNKHLTIMADYYSYANEFQLAIDRYAQADQAFDQTGQSAYLAGRIASMQQDWQQAKRYLKIALEKGSLERKDQVQIMLAIALMNLQDFDNSRVLLLAAKEDTRSLKASQRWLNYLNNEQKHVEAVNKYL